MNKSEYDIKSNACPSMHTAEHLLNQTMVRKFSCDRCYSAHINRKKSKCDYRFTRAITEDEVKEIEEAVNEKIKEDLEVREEFMSKEEAGARYNLSRLPEDSPDNLRIIKIGDYDACPCRGEHAKKTSELGSFKIISACYNDGSLRIRYKLLEKSNTPA